MKSNVQWECHLSILQKYIIQGCLKRVSDRLMQCFGNSETDIGTRLKYQWWLNFCQSVLLEPGVELSRKLTKVSMIVCLYCTHSRYRLSTLVSLGNWLFRTFTQLYSHNKLLVYRRLKTVNETESTGVCWLQIRKKVQS